MRNYLNQKICTKIKQMGHTSIEDQAKSKDFYRSFCMIDKKFVKICLTITKEIIIIKTIKTKQKKRGGEFE